MKNVASSHVLPFRALIDACWKEKYTSSRFIRDLIAGITVGIIAIPLAMLSFITPLPGRPGRASQKQKRYGQPRSMPAALSISPSFLRAWKSRVLTVFSGMPTIRATSSTEVS